MTELVTQVSDFHRNLMRWLEARGVTLQEEVPFPPYTVDIYLSAYHAVIEADGPMHTEAGDRARDRVLEEQYGLKILHVDYALFGDEQALAVAVGGLFREAHKDVTQRWEKHKMRLPWL